MRRRMVVLAGLVLGAAVVAAPAVEAGPAPDPAPPAPTETIAACPPAPEGFAQCFAEVVAAPSSRSTEAGGPRVPEATSVPEGVTPQWLKAAYGFPRGKRAGQGQTIAVVSAFDAPTIEADLAVFSEQFGLPPCTTANGCFTKVDKDGGTNYPAVDPGWALETSLDVEWVHAIAPGAKILLVEATTSSFVDLFAAFNYARQHATYLSNSWGGAEFAGQTIFDPLFAFPGISEFFGSGDFGAGSFFPASSPQVIAVGGTRLKLRADGSFKREVAWSGSGGGCSEHYEANPVQAAFLSTSRDRCRGQRITPDLSNVGDPQTGVAIYDSTPVLGESGWMTVGGTSASTPIVAARAAVTGQIWDAAYVYAPNRLYRDIVKGSNGFRARVGFDLVTGRGSPLG